MKYLDLFKKQLQARKPNIKISGDTRFFLTALTSIIVYYSLALIRILWGFEQFTFSMTYEDAEKIISKSLQFGVGLTAASLAILGLLYSIWVAKEKSTDYLQTIFSNTRFYPILRYILLNIGLLFIFSNIPKSYSNDLGDIYPRISELAGFSFILMVCGLGYIYYKIYVIVSTDFLFKDYIHNLTLLLEGLEKKHTEYLQEESIKKKNQHKEALNILWEQYKTKVKRLESKFYKSLREYDTAVILETTDVFATISEKTTLNRFTEDVARIITKGFGIALSEKNGGLIFEVIEFWYKLLRKAIKNKHLSMTRQLLNLSSYFYQSCFDDKYTKQSIADAIALRLNESWRLQEFILQREDASDIDLRTIIYGQISNAFTSLIRRATINNDHEGLKTIINYFNQPSSDNALIMLSYDEITSRIGAHNPEPTSFDHIAKVFTSHRLSETLQKSYARAIMSWICKAYASGKLAISQSDILNIMEYFTNPNDVNLHFANLDLELIFLLKSWYLAEDNPDIENWDDDINPPLAWKTQWGEAAQTWVFWSFVISTLRRPQLIDFDSLRLIIEDDSIEYLSTRIDDICNSIQAHYEKWDDILRINTQTELDQRIASLKTFFIKLKQRQKSIYNNRIVMLELSNDKIIRYINESREQFNDRSQINALFQFYHNEIVEAFNPAINPSAMIVFSYNYLGVVKRQFVTGPESYNLGLSDGTRLAQEYDYKFLNHILRNATAQLSTDLFNSIDTMILSLQSKGISPDTILISNEVFHNNLTDLFRNPNFEQAHDSSEHNCFVGKYKGINLSRVYMPPPNFTLVANWESAFKCISFENDQWHDHRIEAHVSEITEQEAKLAIEANPQLLIDDDGETLSQDEAALKIRTGIHIRLQMYSLFEIIDSNAYEVTNITYPSELENAN